MTNNGARAYTWDEENRLIQVRDMQTNEILVQNKYDGQSRRRETAGGIGGIMGGTTASASVFYHYDGNGNVTATTDAEGTAISRLEYEPLGRILLSTGTDLPRFQFSSKEYDEASGLNYYGYRFYNPQLGRWINRDPIGENGSINVYQFNKNHPTGKLDLMGLFSITFSLTWTSYPDHTALGRCDPFSSALLCECTPCKMDCTLNSIIFINITPAAYSLPDPFFFDLFIHELKHADAFKKFFVRFGARVRAYEKAYSSKKQCELAVHEIVSDFDSELASFAAWQASDGPCDGHPCGWDQ